MLLGILSGFVASLLGWQINMIAIQKGTELRKRVSLMVGFGAVCADLIFIYLIFKGTGHFLQRPHWWILLKWVGVVTLFGLAIRILLKKAQMTVRIGQRNKGIKRYFLLGFIVVITNPAVFFLWIGVISFIMTHFPPAHPDQFHWRFLAGFWVGGTLWFFTLASLIIPLCRNWKDAYLTLISRMTACLLILVGIFLVSQKW